MALHVALQHRTAYTYDHPVEMGPQIIRLRPAPHCRTRIVSYSLEVEPKDHFLNWQQDPHSNYLARLLIPEKTTRFSVEVGLVADIAVINPFDFFLEPLAETVPFDYEPLLKKDLEPYLELQSAGPRLQELLASIPKTSEATVPFLVALNGRLEQEIDYVIRMEPGIQTCEQTLALGRGSCRDSAWLLVQILRHRGLAARFVSGYLIQLKPDVEALDGPSGTSEDFTDLHAWAEVYLPGAGWVGLDPTSGLFAGEGHIPLACTPDPQNAAPITGSAGPAEVDFTFDMKISRILETPRVTKPYTDEQWAAIVEVGDEVDRQLTEGDVRLTMGGEPTFVGIDDPDADEWNIAADGEDKRAQGDVLIRRLRDRFAPHSLMHFGQGKWYPGEELPRWSYALYWRQDQVPLWRDPKLISADPQPESATPANAERLATGLAERLGLDADYVIPAFENPLGRATDPKETDDPLFVPGLGVPRGFVLPVQPWQAHAAGRSHEGAIGGMGWRSEHWPFPEGRLILIPGDSAIGYRLPLGQLPEVAPDDWPHVYPLDPFAARAALPQRMPVFQRRSPIEEPEPSAESEPVRTALTVEPRNGHLNVFLPPAESAEDFCALIEAIEDTAASQELPVRIEGYAPPADPRLDAVKVTPDPGVIEVNIQPAQSWRDQIEITEALYEEARLARLTVEKFMIDGRHTGTGGGNHIVVGGPSAEDSPFLRRPDLLASLITYWQNHPSLSFLFSGLFIGPTSQSPRVDEARNDGLYELEIALWQTPGPAEPSPPWLVDRLFRNLLVDVAG
ncbi:MAG: transglutaminase family protein, partial [Pseudomonadota bacterium]